MAVINDKILNLLYRSYEVPLNEEEQRDLDSALSRSKELQKEKGQIEAQRRAVQQSGKDFSFNPAFADRVISRLKMEGKNGQKGDIFFENLLNLFKSLSAAAAAASILIMAYNLAKGESLQADEAFFISQVAYEEIIDMPLF